MPKELDLLVMCALSKKPEDRFASASEMREALVQVLEAPAKRRAQAQKRMRKVGMAVAAAGIVGALLGSRWVMRPIEPAAVATTEATVETKEQNAPLAVQTTSAEPPANVEPAAVPPAASVATEPPAASPIAASTDTRKADVDKGREARLEKLESARKFAKGHMSDPRALKAWATAAYRFGDYREARRAGDAWTLHDGTSEPRIFVATVLDTMGKKTEARAVLEEWMQVHPDAMDARGLYARIGGTNALDTAGKKSIARR